MAIDFAASEVSTLAASFSLISLGLTSFLPEHRPFLGNGFAALETPPPFAIFAAAVDSFEKIFGEYSLCSLVQ